MLPKCTSIPRGPQLTRKERPSARPASIKAPSLSFVTEDEESTREYLRDGRYNGGLTSYAKEARYVCVNYEQINGQNNRPLEIRIEVHLHQSHDYVFC